jgi:hypothetical protein
MELKLIGMICSKVQILSSGISQFEGSKLVAAVSKEGIRQVKLCYDSRSRHPFLQFLAGFVLMLTGLIMLLAEFVIAEGGIMFIQMKFVTFGLPIVPILLWAMVGAGAWLLIGVFRGRYNFLIKTDVGIRKIYFEESVDIRDIRDFITRAKVELGYEIDATIMDTMHV